MARTRNADRAHDARRMAQQSAKGALWKNRPSGYDADRMRRSREKYGREPRFVLEDSFDPLTIRSNNICVCGDWHIPFYDAEFMASMYDVCRERGVEEIAIPGDFWDCDNYSRFVSMTQANQGFRETFRGEVDEIATVLSSLVERFKGVYFCRGNHEKRWMDMNCGMMGMTELFRLTGINEGYHLTNDDHMVLFSGDETWLLCHPRNFRQINLSVARDLCSKYRCNVFAAHGHQFAQGTDRSGRYQLVDGGGLFDARALEYLRNTSTFPAVQGGFYIIQDGRAFPYKNDNCRIDLDARAGRALSI